MSRPTTMQQPETNEVARQIVDRSVYGYAEEYAHLENGDKFSFKNHNYLIGIYQDPWPYIVLEKSAQMGASIYAILKSFFVCDKKRRNVIYFFPTDTDVLDFSKTRIGPIIKNSPHISEVTGNDALGLRQVGDAWLYCRGMRSKVAMKSVPADMLVFDELDEIPVGSEELADQRLNHSDLQWRLKLSTPTYENFGIDREFKMGDQRYWNLVCKTCGARTITEKTFPECVKRLTETVCVLICQRCKRELDPQYGEWIADAPDKSGYIHSYHICGLYSYYINLSRLMYDYDGGRGRDELMRSKLGMPYVSAEQRCTIEMVRACLGDFEMHIDSHVYMGVDQKGNELHITIRKPNRLAGKSETIFIGKVERFGQLDEYMRRYDVNLCVIDGTPNQHSARDFSRRFPGRVYLCFYQDSQKGEYSWRESETPAGVDYIVLVNRTEALDAMYEQIGRREVALPKLTPEVEELATQLTNMARENVTDEEGTIKGAVWKKLGPDHYAHSLSYSLIAQTKYGSQTPSSIILQSPVMARVIRPSRRHVAGRY